MNTFDQRNQKVDRQYNAGRNIYIHENKSRVQQNQIRSINHVQLYVPMPSTVYIDSVTLPPASPTEAIASTDTIPDLGIMDNLPQEAIASTDTISDWGSNEMFSDSGLSSIDGSSHDLVATTDMSTNLDSAGIDYDSGIFGSDFSLPSL